MKKMKIKAFTLVEMLIVIVIIGILIASLMPRMQQAQSRARDVTRKNDLAQMQTAIISYYGDANQLPKCNGTATRCPVTEIQAELKAGGLDVVPTDPIESQTYYYGMADRNGHSTQGFRLAANTEVAGVSNYVSYSPNHFLSGEVTDTATFKPCKYVSQKNEADFMDQDSENCHGSGGNFWYVITY